MAHARHEILVNAAFIGVYLLLSLYILAVFLIGSDFMGSPLRFLDGTGPRPNVYRALIPWTVSGMVALTPQMIAEYCNAALLAMKESEAFKFLVRANGGVTMESLNNGTIYATALAVFLVWLLMLGYIAALYALARRLFPVSRIYALLAPIVSLLALAAFHPHFAYGYDYSMLFLLTAAMYAMVVENKRWYYVLFLLAVMNKETSIYIIFLYLLYHCGTLKPGKLFLETGRQLFLYILIRLYISSLYQHNPGVELFSSWGRQVESLIHGYSFSTYLTALFFFFLLTFRWQEKPVLLRRSCLLLPALGLAFLWLGFPYEYRQFLDFLPFGTMLATHTLVRAAGFDHIRLFDTSKE